jgi:hypothetical protein
VARAAQEKQRAEDEEAAKWMNMISVEDTVRVARVGGGGQCLPPRVQLLQLLRAAESAVCSHSHSQCVACHHRARWRSRLLARTQACWGAS